LEPRQPVYAEFRNSQQITEEINSLRERIEAIRLDCEQNNRDITDEEQAEIDAIMGSGEPGTANYKQGKMVRLQAALERTKRIEENQAALAAERARAAAGSHPGTSAGLQPGTESPNLDVAPSAIIVPSQYRIGRPLQAFSGPHAEAQAYTAGRFYLAALFDHEPSRQWCAQHGIKIVRGAQTGGVDTKGGFLVPSELASTIMTYAYSYGVILQDADVRRMTTDTLDVTKEVGDPEAQWMGATNGADAERQPVPELDFDYASYKLVANKLGALTRMSSEISEDAIVDMADNITVRLARAAAKQLDKTGFLGTGNAASGGFTGILPALANGSRYIPPNGVLSYAAFTKPMFDTIVGRVEEYADESRCAWYVNKKFYTLAMAPIKEAIGGNDAMELTDGTGRRRLFFLGYPVRFCSIFPKNQAAIPVNTWLGGFGDLFQSLLVGVRRDIQIAISTEAFFTTDEIGIRLLMRGAIMPHDVGDANNGGAFIGIRSAAA
jgi:HK97 family phage major capsid protein